AVDAVRDIPDGASLAVGGFGLCGVPHTLIQALYELGSTNLETVSNNCGIDDAGLGVLLGAGRIRRTISSYVGENKEFARQYLQGELELELTPQGTLAERLRAGGAGIPAFYTPAGVGTSFADGKEVREIEGKLHVMELALKADYALIRAHRADTKGNLVYRNTGRNFNPLMATAA